jgi:hypothetical protein
MYRRKGTQLEILNGWKDIANYLRMGVSTVLANESRSISPPLGPVNL